MKKFLLAMLTMLMGLQSVQAMNVDAFIDKHIAPISDAVANAIFVSIPIAGGKIPLIILWILAAGFFFTIFFKGISIWGLKHAIDSVCKKPENSEGCGDVSSFQALATALSGTIGIGSIAGVAISISIGGPGAAFWIFFGAILGMSIKFIEAALAVKYRRFNLDGSVSGGPMHYIAHGLTRRKMRWLGQPLSVLFAILCIGGGITGGNMIQINQTAHQIIFITGGENSIFHGYAWILGTIAAILIGLVVMGGIKGIAKVTTVLTPTMCALYIFSGLIVIFANFTSISLTRTSSSVSTRISARTKTLLIKTYRLRNSYEISCVMSSTDVSSLITAFDLFKLTLYSSILLFSNAIIPSSMYLIAISYMITINPVLFACDIFTVNSLISCPVTFYLLL